MKKGGFGAKNNNNKKNIYFYEKGLSFLAAQVEKMEPLGAAKAKNGRLFRGTPVLSKYGSTTPRPLPHTHTNPGGGRVAGNIKGFSARTHLNMAHLSLFTPPLQCKSRL